MEERTELRTSSCNTTGPTKRLVSWSAQPGLHLNAAFEKHLFFSFHQRCEFSRSPWVNTIMMSHLYSGSRAPTKVSWLLSYQCSESRQRKQANLYLTKKKRWGATLQSSAGNSLPSLFRSLLVFEVITPMLHSAAVWVEHKSERCF